MSVRTGPFKTLQAALTIANTNKTACADTFQAKGNSAKLYVTTTGVANTITFTAATSPDGTNYFDLEDASWTVEASAAGNYSVNLSGLSLAPLDHVKIYYQCETAAGDLTVKVLNYETSGGSGGSVSLSNATEDDACPSEGMPIIGRVSTSQRAAMSNGDGVILTVNEHGEIVLNGYHWTGEYLQVAESNPIDSKGAGDTKADVSNGTDGTYEYHVDISNKKEINVLGLIDGGSGAVTVTFELSLQDDGDAAADCDFLDISQYGMENLIATSTAASYTADFLLKLKEGVRGKYLKIKVLAASTADDGDWRIDVFTSAI